MDARHTAQPVDMTTSKVTKVVSKRRAWRERQRQGLLRSWQPGGAHHERFRSGEADADTMRRRALDDARGTVIREGITYRPSGRSIGRLCDQSPAA
jgi:hypothetical protein